MIPHPLLARQLRRAFGSVESAPAELSAFLAQVSDSYQQFDQARRFSDHVMETSSNELTAANAALNSQNQHNQAVLESLLVTVGRLHPDKPDDQPKNLLEVAAEIERLVTRSQEVEATLRQAKAAADAANQSKSEFLANMSHEIRTPLNAVVGMTSVLLDANLGSTEREYVEIIRQNGDSLLDIINDILDFSKIEAGRIELDLIPCDLRASVEQVLDLFSERARHAGLDLGVSFGTGVPECVVTDPTRLRQILVNLVGNALKFTPRGGVGIFIDASPAHNGWTLDFHVEDSGIGIPADRLNRLFKAFSQVDTSTTRKYGGTGLGLAITHRLVGLLGGNISVTSQPDHGTTFHFSVPAGLCNDHTRPVPLDTSALARLRALVVDDIAINRRILEQQLLGWGIQVTLADSAHDALARFSPGAFDVLLLDFNMPDLDGAQLARELHRRHPDRVPHIILLSSRGQQSDVAGPLIARRLTKPVKPTELLAHLRETLATSGSVASPAPKPAPSSFALDRGFAERHPLRILVAEDVAVNRKVIDLYLSRLGYHGTAVNDGREVITALGVETYDVILMDMQMPEMDGISAARHLRALPGGGQHPYIIALTAHALTEHQAAALASGMQDYLAKPLRAEALADSLRRAHAWLQANPRPGLVPGRDSHDASQL